MRTVYDKTGRPRVFKQDIDALHAVEAGFLFETPPKGTKVAEKQKPNKDSMSAQQLVAYAKEEYGVDLNPLTRKDLLISTIEELENPKPIVRPKERAKKTLRKRMVLTEDK